jgi:hypothetical protein
MNWNQIAGLRTFVLVCFAGFVWACGGTADGSNPSGGCGGPAPDGTTCQKAGGGCEALVCEGSSWTCPAGDTQVALTAAACMSGDAGGGNADGGNPGCTGTAPDGATCQKPGGGCEGLVCQGTTWACPAGDTQVALTAGNCAGGEDAGTD